MQADDIVALAKEYGWQTKIYSDADAEGEYQDIQISSDWGLDTPLWSWGIMVRWYRTSATRWRLGITDNGHGIVGVYIGADNVEREFWLRSLKVLRECIVEPAILVELFEKGIS